MLRHSCRRASVFLVLLALMALSFAGCAAEGPAAVSPEPSMTESTATQATSGTSATSAASATSSTSSATDPSPTASGTSAASTPEKTTLAATTTTPAACTISVVCHTAVAYGNKIAPSDGIILPPTGISLQPGDTVLTVLARAVTAANLRVVGGAYVSGIGNDAMADLLYEKDCGPESGWLFFIDGTYVSDGASRRIVQPGENIEWKYTCASGRDLA